MHPARHLFQPAANQRLGQSFDGAELVGIHGSVHRKVAGNTAIKTGIAKTLGALASGPADDVATKLVRNPAATNEGFNNPKRSADHSSPPNDSGHVAAQVVVSVPAGNDDQAKLRQGHEWHAAVFAQDVHGVENSAQGCVGLVGVHSQPPGQERRADDCEQQVKAAHGRQIACPNEGHEGVESKASRANGCVRGLAHARSFASRCAGDAVRGLRFDGPSPSTHGGRCFRAMAATTRSLIRFGRSSGHSETAPAEMPMALAALDTVPPSRAIASSFVMRLS